MASREGLDKETGEIYKIKAERFTKTMLEVWRELNKHEVFTTAEEKTLHRLSMFLQLNTNAIVTPSGSYMSIEKMADETNIDRSNIRKVIKELIKKNAIGMWKSGEYEIYYMNPFLYQRGEIKSWLFGLFDDEYHKRCEIDHMIGLFKANQKKTSLVVPKKLQKTAI